jgi:hypothetical protein
MTPGTTVAVTTPATRNKKKSGGQQDQQQQQQQQQQQDLSSCCDRTKQGTGATAPAAASGTTPATATATAPATTTTPARGTRSPTRSSTPSSPLSKALDAFVSAAKPVSPLLASSPLSSFPALSPAAMEMFAFKQTREMAERQSLVRLNNNNRSGSNCGEQGGGPSTFVYANNKAIATNTCAISTTPRIGRRQQHVYVQLRRDSGIGHADSCGSSSSTSNSSNSSSCSSSNRVALAQEQQQQQQRRRRLGSLKNYA